jgi:acyl carrier protein
MSSTTTGTTAATTTTTSPVPAPVPSDAEVLEGIAQVAREHLDWQGRLEPGMRLIEDLELDSLKSLTLAVEVENRFRVCLEPDVEALVVTVGDLVAAVRARLSEAGAEVPR